MALEWSLCSGSPFQLSRRAEALRSHSVASLCNPFLKSLDYSSFEFISPGFPQITLPSLALAAHQVESMSDHILKLQAVDLKSCTKDL